jgi:hypothetical protein
MTNQDPGYIRTTFTPVFEAVSDLVSKNGALVYGAIWRFCQGSPTKTCTASIDSLAERAYLGEKSVRRYIPKLEDVGLIITDKKPGERLRIRCTDRLVQGEPTFYFRTDDPGQGDRISGQSDRTSGQSDRGNRREDQERKEKQPTPEEILGEEVLARKPDQAEPREQLTDETYKAKVLQTMIAGTITAAEIRSEVHTQLNLNVPNTKNGQRFLTWLLEEHRSGRTVAQFAHWWRTKDWRGIDGQHPASLNQVETIWPQAFAKEPGEPEKIQETDDGGLMW